MKVNNVNLKNTSLSSVNRLIECVIDDGLFELYDVFQHFICYTVYRLVECRIDDCLFELYAVSKHYVRCITTTVHLFMIKLVRVLD